MSGVWQSARRVAISAVQGARQIHLSRVSRDTFTTNDAVMSKPSTTTIAGYLGVTFATSLGIFTGAQISKNIASFLEENELFVPSDDDDDD